MDGMILAGGKSTRMGQHKGELSLGTETFVSHLVNCLRENAEHIYISYGDTVHRDYEGCEILLDTEKGLGPIEGLVRGLSSCISHRLMVAACDMPYLTPEFFRHLASELDAHPDAAAVIPMLEGRMNPLAAIYTKDALPYFEKSIAAGDYRLRSAIREMPVHYITLSAKEACCLRNVNTKEEYRCMMGDFDPTVRVSIPFAGREILKNVSPVPETETCSLFSARGRILAADICAPFDNPPFDRSPLDGYAVIAEDTTGASRSNPVTLDVIGEVTAGSDRCLHLQRGQAVRIMTGAPVPPGADAVIRQEQTDFGEKTVNIYAELKHHDNYCFAGEDFKKGDLLISQGTELTPAALGTAASTGVTEVSVYRRPAAALITTGDEVQSASQGDLKNARIYNSNLYCVGAVLERHGAEMKYCETAGDDAGKIAERIRNICDDVDIIVTTGGVSVGKKDIMHDVFALLGCRRLFWRVNLKPGMPTLAGIYRGKLIIALSGNPYGAFVNAELFAGPALRRLAGNTGYSIPRVKAVCTGSFGKKSGIVRYLRANYSEGHVTPVKGGIANSSGVLSTASACNALIEIPAGTPRLDEGDEVWVILL